MWRYKPINNVAPYRFCEELEKLHNDHGYEFVTTTHYGNTIIVRRWEEPEETEVPVSLVEEKKILKRVGIMRAMPIKINEDVMEVFIAVAIFTLLSFIIWKL